MYSTREKPFSERNEGRCGGTENPKAETSQVTHTGAQIPKNESTEVDYNGATNVGRERSSVYERSADHGRSIGTEGFWNLGEAERPEDEESVRQRMPGETAVPVQRVNSSALMSSPDSAYETLMKIQYCPVESNERVTPNEVRTKSRGRQTKKTKEDAWLSSVAKRAATVMKSRRNLKVRQEGDRKPRL